MHIAPIVWRAPRVPRSVPAGCYCFNCAAHTRQNKSRTHTSTKFEAKNLLRLNALNSRVARSIQRALSALNENENKYTSRFASRPIEYFKIVPYKTIKSILVCHIVVLFCSAAMDPI
jgi:hypothetical protein